MVNLTLSWKGGINAPPSFPLSTRSFGLIFLPKVINAEDTSSFLLMTLWKTSSYKEHNRISKVQQAHREAKGSYGNLMKTRCPRLITLTWFESAPPTLILSLTVQLPLCKIQFFKKALDLNCGGNSKDTKAEGRLLGLEKFNQLFSRYEKIHSKQRTNEYPQAFLEMSYSKVWILKLCPSSPGYHETVLEISCKKERKKKMKFEPFQASLQHLDQVQKIRRILRLKKMRNH